MRRCVEWSSDSSALVRWRRAFPDSIRSYWRHASRSCAPGGPSVLSRDACSRAGHRGLLFERGLGVGVMRGLFCGAAIGGRVRSLNAHNTSALSGA